MTDSFKIIFHKVAKAAALTLALIWTGCLAPKLGDPNAEQLPAAGRHLKKVLFFWLDKDGQYSQHPSMFERDAYQAYLRENPEEIHGLKVAILLSGSKGKLESSELELKIQGPPGPEIKEPLEFRLELADQVDRKLRRWVYWDIDPVNAEASDGSLKLLPEAIVSWRLTLLDEDQPVDRLQSYLWNIQRQPETSLAIEEK